MLYIVPVRTFRSRVKFSPWYGPVQRGKIWKVLLRYTWNLMYHLIIFSHCLHAIKKQLKRYYFLLRCHRAAKYSINFISLFFLLFYFFSFRLSILRFWFDVWEMRKFVERWPSFVVCRHMDRVLSRDINVCSPACATVGSLQPSCPLPIVCDMIILEGGILGEHFKSFYIRKSWPYWQNGGHFDWQFGPYFAFSHVTQKRIKLGWNL